MLKAFRHPPIKRLWVGQAFSSIGDEIYRVGLTWLAVGLIGADTGYLSAAQAAALMTLSFVGGKWAEHWDPLRTMIRVDLLRALIVLIPVTYSYFAPVPFSLLVGVAIVLSGLGAFFDPALQTVLPKFSPNIPTLRAATGLMTTTIRLARMVGPAIVSAISGIVPPIHYFTLDSLSFIFSAGMLLPLQTKALPKHVRAPRQSISFHDAIFGGFKALQKQRGMSFILLAKAVTSSTWNLAFGLGFALLVNELTPGDTRSFGMVIAAYGLGNFAGALFFGNQERPRPAHMMFVGFVWMGVGFIGLSHCRTIEWIMAWGAFAGFSGTMNEVTFFDLVQSRFPLSDIARIVRLRLATDTATSLVLYLIAPMLFRMLPVSHVIEMCGVLWVVTGLVGYTWFRAHFNVTSRH